MLADRRLDAAFVQCPIYEWFKPDAYNYSKSKEERARVVDVEDDLAVGPRHWAGMGVSCADYVDNVLRPAISAAGGGLGLRCHKHTADGTWAVHSKSGVTPIDRYAVVGGRRRDAIHPFFNAQFAIVQLMLNHLCPAGP